MLISDSFDAFILATVYQLGYFWFYYDESMLLGGQVPVSVTILMKGGRTNYQAPSQLMALKLKQCGIPWLGDFIQVCWQKTDSRNMLIFLTINLLFMFIEMFYGIYSNCLGLISDAFHMFSDNCSLGVALTAAYISQTSQANAEFTYGYVRAETLSGFFNAVLLIFLAFNVFI